MFEYLYIYIYIYIFVHLHIWTVCNITYQRGKVSSDVGHGALHVPLTNNVYRVVPSPFIRILWTSNKCTKGWWWS